MPNHCDNDLRIHGDQKEIERFFNAVRGDEEGIIIDANKIIPYPKEYADADKASEEYRKKNPGASFSTGPKDGFNNGGYEWCCKNWGTKWGLYDFYNNKEFKKSAAVSFNTAWSPPNPIILAASKLFPKLTFTLRYYEQGAAFQGIYRVKNGEVLEDDTWDYRGGRGG
jgi:hypothetical protein